jgi:type II secretory ATPase GspE/PulE/Tfp pilus assembly ATPase PilB-like protein
LVFSTLNTNDAPSALTRLTEMGIEKYLVEATVIGVVAQRLVRKRVAHGYKGRMGIYELMNGIRTTDERKTLRDDAELKLVRGLTSQEEIDRVLAPAD